MKQNSINNRSMHESDRVETSPLAGFFSNIVNVRQYYILKLSLKIQ